MYKESVKYYDKSTIDDLPVEVDHMARQETMTMWAYPEPEYCESVDGGMFPIAGWYIVTSLTGDSWWINMDDDIFMGGDSVIYTGDDEDIYEGDWLQMQLADQDAMLGYTDRYPSHWND